MCLNLHMIYSKWLQILIVESGAFRICHANITSIIIIFPQFDLNALLLPMFFLSMQNYLGLIFLNKLETCISVMHARAIH